MKIFLGNKQSLKCYYLPEDIEESFLVTYRSLVDNEDKIVSIEAINGKWHIKSNLNIGLFYNNAPIEDIELEEYKNYSITFNDCDETVLLICLPSKKEKFKDYDMHNSSLTIGRNSSCDIVYNNILVDDLHIEIKLEESGVWLLKSKSNVYINGVAYNTKALLYGDIIFLYGLKIIWMKGFIRVTDYAKVEVHSLSLASLMKEDNTTYKETTNREKNISLYKENEYFFHTPTLKPKIDHVIITIDSPPAKETRTQLPLFLAIGSFITLAMTSLSSGLVSIIRLIGGAPLMDEILSLVMCVSMMLGSILFPALINRWEKKESEKREKLRLKKYQEYLDEKKNDIIRELNSQANKLKSFYSTPIECYNMITYRKENMWNREIADPEFLNIRFGIGDEEADIEIDAQRLGFTLDDDVLRDKLKEIQEAKLTMVDVPIINSLIDNTVFAAILNCSNKKSYIDSILLQLMAYYSPSDLKIVFLVNEKNNAIWDDYKCLAHTISEDKSVRFFAYKDDDMKNVSSYLEGVFQERNNSIKNSNHSQDSLSVDNPKEYYKVFDSYYLIITDDILHTKGVEIINKILNSQSNYGFSLLIFERSFNNLPSNCKQFVYIKDKEADMFTEEVSLKGMKKFKPEFINGVNMNYLVYQVSNIPVATSDGASILPPSLDFLEMYKVGKLEQLNIFNRWSNNDPTLSLSTPIGVHPNGNLFELNLHEKAEGPHGLIAGSTGSGKSEFIITYILSMCINYSPYEVQFVLIDYKGGGLAGAFENRDKGTKIPHLVGTITNLDTSEMNRTLVSIRSELKRRQVIFNETREALGESTIDIYKYQKSYRDGLVSEPIAHLFIISDEFAELKAQQPDFMDELVSTARIGRSLGVHLILSTQKPSGVVDDQIWSNSRFKICLKVQSVADSQEMLRREEAAYIKETGRFYLQVGYDEVFELGQSAWSGAKYIPSNVIEKKIDDSINFINDSGMITKTINNVVKKEEVADQGEQLTNIVNYLIDLSNKENILTYNLWLPSIPEEIYLGNIIKKYQFKPVPYEYMAIVGEYDDPENQAQSMLSVNLSESGNMILFGLPGSGKENQIETMLYSLCIYHHPHELNIYIMDFGAEVLKIFSSMPQVGDYVTSYDADKVVNLLKMLEREYQSRKEKLADYGGSFQAYNKASSIKMPLIITVINNYEGFLENFGDFEDSFSILFRETTKAGMIFITTATAQNSISSRVSQNFTTVFGMKFADPFDYRYLLDAPAGLVPKKCFGRGLTKVNERALEYQSAYINVFDSINQTVKNTAIELAKHYKVKAKPVPTIPSKVNSNTMSKYINSLSDVPLGIDLQNINVAKYDFMNPRITIISSEDIRMCGDFLSEFYNILTKIPNTTFALYDSLLSVNIPNVIPSITDADEFVEAINNVVTKEEQPVEHRVVIIAGIQELLNSITNEEQKNTFINILDNIIKYSNTSIIMIDDYQNYRDLSTEKWYQDSVSDEDGIWIGTGCENQIIFKSKNEIQGDLVPDYTYDQGFIIVKGKATLVKVIASEG